jgi:Tfp pilus assembly protein PilV
MLISNIFMNFNKKKLKSEKSSGFTLIEIVLSIFIMSMALVAIFSAFSIIVISTSDTLNQLTATYLAQEGMEIVRNIRDTNWLNMDYHSSEGASSTYTWLDGGMLDICESGCVVDYATTGDPAHAIGSYGSGSYLYINNNGFYTFEQESNNKTIFQRKITIVPISDVNGDEVDGEGTPIYHIIKVKVEVFWDKKRTILSDGVKASDGCGDTNCITTEGTLYNWYNYNTQ